MTPDAGYGGEARRRVGRQLALSIAVLIGCVLSASLLELFRFPGRLAWLLALDGAIAAVAVGAVLISRAFPERSIPVAVVAVNLVGVLLNGYHAAVGSPIAVSIWTLTALLCTAALLLGWGWRAQALASIGAVFGYGLHWAGAPDTMAWLTGGVYLGWVVGLSLAGASLIDRFLQAQFRLVGQLREALACEQEARRNAEAASRAKDEFLAVVSHELRTPLTAIFGWTPLLREGRLNAEDQHRALDAIERSGRSLVQLIDDLLDVARIVSGKLRLNVRSAELGSILQAAVESMRLAAAARRLQLELQLPPQPEYVLGDPDRLQQVVWNLVSNAIKFTPTDGRVDVSLAREGSELVIRVRDNGRGIAPELLPHVFERFWQADASSTRSNAGLGLGLAIVRHLVELHGGTVSAESSPAVAGAVFCVRLPAQSAALVAAVPTLPLGTAEGFPLRGTRVLVVDDEVEAREVARRVLELQGVEVRTAGSVRQALAILAEWAPTVLVSDIAMPDEDGIALIRQVRTEEAGHGRVPALAFSALARLEDRTRALAAGYDDYLTKPIEPGQFVDRVAAAVGRVERGH